MKKRKLLFLLLLLIPAVFVAVPLVRAALKPKESTDGVQGAPVVVEYPKRTTIAETLEYPGTLLPQKTVTVTPKVSGKILKIHVKEGERVVADQLLVSLDDEIVKLQEAQARAAFNAAEAQYQKAQKGVRKEELENAKALLAQAERDIDVARANLERAERLYKAGTISKSKYEESDNAFKQALTQVDNARRNVNLMEEGATKEDLAMAHANMEAMKAQFELAKLQSSYAQVKAPGAGIVAKVLVDAGNMVDTRTALIAIVQDDPVYVEIPVPEKHYGRFAEKRNSITALVSPIAYEGREPFHGTVHKIATIVDAASRTFLVEVEVENPEGLLRPGMYVNVKLQISTKERALAIPRSALVFREDRQAVFVLSGTNPYKAIMKPVDVGIEQDSLVEVVSGISEDDMIITEGNAFLEDGQPVSVIRK